MQDALPMTVLQSLVAALLAAAAFDRNDQVAPAVILWTDEDKQWIDLLPRLREVMPELLTLGGYDPDSNIGPAIWIKCMLGRDDAGKPLMARVEGSSSMVPIVYLPGVGRQHLRAVEECAAHLKPLCELQYRGVLWTQQNGKDWTLRAFLQSADGGLGLSLAGDAATLGAMRQALEKLANVSVARLRGRQLDASDFHELLSPDPARTVLDWLSDAAGFKARAGTAWGAFRTVCKDKFGFDPDKTDPTKAGQLLAERQAPWAAVWSRFEENPALYPGVKDVLRRSKPVGAESLFGGGVSVYPQDNEAGEVELRADLANVGAMNEAAARERLAELEQRHARRRGVVWAKVGEAPLAAALWHLAQLATLSAKPLGGGNPDEAAKLYADAGWRVDDAAMAALATVRVAADCVAVGAAVAAVYRPWLEKAAENFQKLVAAKPLPTAAEATELVVEPGTCMVFADGLRMDLGQRLAAVLGARGLAVTVGWRWSAVPTVTATAKPAASPVSAQIDRASVGDDFVPRIVAGGKSLTADRFRALLKERGVAVLVAGDNGAASDTGAAWLEVGTIDHRGHSEGVRLAGLLDEEVRSVAERVAELLGAGWTRVKVVTDHGWLLMPGGLPKVVLPKFLVETRWGRCAAVKAGASPECQQHGWHWNPAMSIALAPGIACFTQGYEYAHGGLSVQEAVTPVLVVTASGAGAAAVGSVSIASIVWNQLTGRVSVSGGGGVAVDLRRDAADAGSTLMDLDKPRPLDAAGQAKMYAKDEAEGQEAEVVVLDANGNVVARHRTRVGME